MKNNKIYIFLIMVMCTILVSCSKVSVEEDITDKLIFEEYDDVIISPSELDDFYLEKYNNSISFTEEELNAINVYKDKKLTVGIPMVPGFLDTIQGENIGTNIYAVLQLEKDLGIDFEIIYGETDELMEMFDNNEIDIVSGVGSTNLIKYFSDDTLIEDGTLSDPYFARNYAIYSKNNYGGYVDVSMAFGQSVGVYLPYYEDLKAKQNNYKLNGLKNFESEHEISELVNNSEFEVLILPDNTNAPKYGYYRSKINSSGYVIYRSFMYNKNTVSEELINIVNKTLTPEKEENLAKYQNRAEQLKCYDGYFFTDEEIEFLKNAPPIRVEYLSDSYPNSFYDTNLKMYNGKLVVLLNRISIATGLKFETKENETNPSMNDILVDLYSEDVDLAVGLTESFNRNFYSVMSNNIAPEDSVLIGYKSDVSNLSDLYAVNIGVLESSFLDDYLSETLPSKSIYKYASSKDAYEAIKSGEIDYYATNQNELYYLINTKSDFNLKTAYNFNIQIDNKYAAPNTKEGQLLISIINKTLYRIDKETVLNSNYPLSKIDSLSTYRNFLYLKIFMVASFFLVLIGFYFLYELRKSREKETNIRELNLKLNNALLVAKLGIFSYTLGANHIVLNNVLIDLIGLNDDDLFYDKNQPCVKLNVLYGKYILTKNKKNGLLDIINCLKTDNQPQYRDTINVIYGGDKSSTRYLDLLVEFEPNSANNSIFCIVRDITKDVLYEQYEQSVLNKNESTEAKNRNSAFKLDVSKYIGKTVVYLDLDDFNKVNNTYGHKKGDEALNEVINLLEGYEHTKEIFRMSGDEFFIVLDEYNESIPLEIEELIRIPVVFNNVEFLITCSLGIFTIREDNNLTIEEVVNISNFAMLIAKSNGKSTFVEVDDKMLERYREDNRLDGLLKSAIVGGEIIPFFQPYIDIKTNRVVGYETLMRWRTENGILSPFSFLSMAVKSGLIYDIDLLMYRESISFLKYLQNENLVDDNFIASSNFTSITLMRIKAVDLLNIADEIGIDPQNITIEITEQLFADDEAFARVHELKEYGFKIALDDFSVGHSSMSYLKKLSVDVLKLDKSLLDDSADNKVNLAIFGTVVNLGRSLNAKIVSEGVETRADEQVLIDTHVNVGQGYYYARPSDKDTFIKFVKSRNL